MRSVLMVETTPACVPPNAVVAGDHRQEGQGDDAHGLLRVVRAVREGHRARRHQLQPSRPALHRRRAHAPDQPQQREQQRAAKVAAMKKKQESEKRRRLFGIIAGITAGLAVIALIAYALAYAGSLVVLGRSPGFEAGESLAVLLIFAGTTGPEGPDALGVAP